MLVQILQIFWGKEHLVKNWLLSTLDRVIYYKGTFLQGSTKPLFTTQNRLETSWKNLPVFFLHASSRSKISMGTMLFQALVHIGIRIVLRSGTLNELESRVSVYFGQWFSAHFRALFFHGSSYVLSLTKNWVGRLFRKLIWSPWSKSTREIFFDSKYPWIQLPHPVFLARVTRWVC
jgi:hypothetical protein